jgi:hypothetical protein
MFANSAFAACRKFPHACILIAGLAVIWLFPRHSKAENRVMIESRWVEQGATNVGLGIYISNSDPLVSILLPLEIRMVHVGSFIRRTLKVLPSGRLRTWMGDDIYEVRNFYPFKTDPPTWGNRCPVDRDGKVWRWMSSDSLPDFMGEEALLYFATKAAPGNLPPGSDGTLKTGIPSVTLVFDVTQEGGAFVIDSTCESPGNHLVLLEEGPDGSSYPIAPAFEMGIVLIGCDAECHGDPYCDGECNIVDIITTVDVAFMGAPAKIDPDPRCPTEDTDVNCDMQTDVLDVIRMTNVLYRSQSMASQFCRACDLAPQPGGPKKDPRTPYFRQGGD